MGLFDFLERTAGDPHIKRDFMNLGDVTGTNLSNQGQKLTDEGLTGLRGENALLQKRLSDPLGPGGRGIFERGRGALSDTATQRQRAFGSRIFQLATQSGGTLSPEARAELQARNQKGINEALFSGQNDLATAEATMTLNETGKLFDRMESINKTITGVGQDEMMRGLQAIIQSLSFRSGRMMSIASAGVSSVTGAGK